MRIPWVCYAVQLSVSNVCNVYSTREVSRVMSPFAENDKLTSENNEKRPCISTTLFKLLCLAELIPPVTARVRHIPYPQVA